MRMGMSEHSPDTQDLASPLSPLLVVAIVVGLAVLNAFPAFVLSVPAICGADVPPAGWEESLCDSRPVTLAICALGPMAALLTGLAGRVTAFVVLALASFVYGLALTGTVFVAG
jgi:hypothetical protein